MYCICRKPDDGKGMILCEECEDWFHFRCVGVKSQKQADSISTWICFVCERVSKVQASLSERIVNLEVQLAQQAKILFAGQTINENNNISKHVVPEESTTDSLWKRKLELISNENDELKAKMGVLEEKVKLTSNENEALKASLAQSQRCVELLQNKTSLHAVENEELKLKLAAANSTVEFVEKLNKSTSDENEALKASLAQSQRCVELLQNKTSLHAVENEELKLKLAAANSKVEFVEKLNKSTSDENEALKASLAEAHTSIELLRKKTSKVDDNHFEKTPSLSTPQRKSLSLSQLKLQGKQSSQLRKLSNTLSQPTADKLSDDDFKPKKSKLSNNTMVF